jgi:hypothetical protein
LVLGLSVALLLRRARVLRTEILSRQNENGLGVPDPRLDYSGPFLNVRPDVGYIDDAACADCHVEIAKHYRNHPMGRSLAEIAKVVDRFPVNGRESGFSAFRSSFQVVRQGKRMIHRQVRLDEEGKPVWSLDLPVDYVIGSGTRGYSFLFQREGFLFQTPISWFSQKRVWDRSPGVSQIALAGRPVMPECLYCHANHAHARKESRNGYAELIFEGHAIGCERCHGPGALHVKERNEGVALAGPFDRTIVNPARMEPELRDAVCAQCHLAGEPRVLRRGRGLYDFRPGMPLYLFWSVFVPDREPGSEHKAVNHFEQMNLSRCFQGSSGANRLGCVSCHDPHEKPAEERRVEFYRSRCLQCHQQHGCSLPREERLRRHKQDSCIVCHMPHYTASDIAHTAATDHRIVRKATFRSGSPERQESMARFPVLFYRGSSTIGQMERDRDLGMALASLAAGASTDPSRFARRAVELLDKSVTAFPDDVAGWEAKGQALALLNRLPEALAAFEAALEKAPRRELSLHGAALMAQKTGDRDKALAYWRRAVEVDPCSADYRGNLALLLVHARAWKEARPHAEAWLRLDPASVEARRLHEHFLLRDGDREGAQAERERIERLR